MKKNLLAAITVAVSAYIQQEDKSRAATENRSNAWWLRGQQVSVKAQTNASNVVRPRFGKGLWRYSSLDESLAARARWKVRKSTR